MTCWGVVRVSIFWMYRSLLVQPALHAAAAAQGYTCHKQILVIPQGIPGQPPLKPGLKGLIPQLHRPGVGIAQQVKLRQLPPPAHMAEMVLPVDKLQIKQLPLVNFKIRHSPSLPKKRLFL